MVDGREIADERHDGQSEPLGGLVSRAGGKWRSSRGGRAQANPPLAASENGLRVLAGGSARGNAAMAGAKRAACARSGTPGTLPIWATVSHLEDSRAVKPPSWLASARLAELAVCTTLCMCHSIHSIVCRLWASATSQRSASTSNPSKAIIPSQTQSGTTKTEGRFSSCGNFCRSGT